MSRRLGSPLVSAGSLRTVPVRSSWSIDSYRFRKSHLALSGISAERSLSSWMSVARLYSLAEEVGDEPLLLARTTGAPVFVASRRADAGRALLAAHPEVRVIVSDDGLQHWPLARDLDLAKLDAMTQEVGLAEAIGLGAQILAGQVRGRVVVDVNR